MLCLEWVSKQDIARDLERDQRKMVKGGSAESDLRKIAERAATPFGLEVYELVYRRAGPRWKLQLFLSRSDGIVSLDDCERVSRQFSRELDATDPIPHGYDLEVSSPGLDRALSAGWHWERAVGEKVRVRWRDSDGKVRTEVLALREWNDEDSTATLVSDDGRFTVVALRDVLQARVHVEW